MKRLAILLISLAATAGAQQLNPNQVSWQYPVESKMFPSDVATLLPRTDPTYVQFGTASGCANPADPLGVLDSTCAINAAITFASQAFGSGATSRAVPMVYLPAGKYLISGPIIIGSDYDIGGDGPSPTQIVQSNTTSNIFTIRSQGQFGFFPNPQGWGGGGRIHDLSMYCSTSGTRGSPYNACTGNAIELQSTDLKLENVTVTNWGGRCLMGSNAAEQIYIDEVWFNECRWPISNVGQANIQINNFYAAGPGQDEVYTWGSISHLGFGISRLWNPTSCSITSASTDGAGNASTTVSCSDLTHGYTTGQSSPIPPGGWFVLSGITDSNLVDLNGTFQATAVSGASGSAFTISFQTFNQASQTQWTYTDNDEPMWFCGNGVTCPILTPASHTSTNPAGLFQVASFPAVNGSVNVQTVVGSNHNIRLDQLVYATGWVDNSTGDNVDGIYQEANGIFAPTLQTGFTNGGYIPYTTLTQATNTTGAQTVTVNNASWFTVATGDPTNTNSIAQSAVPYTLACPDFNPNQSGVPCASVSGVNTNQSEEILAAVDTQNNLHIITRHAGGTAPSGVVWPVGTLVTITDFGQGKPANTINMQRYVSNTPGANAGGFYAPVCSDQGANVCAEMIDGRIPNFRTSFPSFSGSPLVIQNAVSNGISGRSDVTNAVLGYGCLKVMGNSPVTLDGAAWAAAVNATALGQLQDGPGIAQGVSRHTLSTCVVFPQQNVNGTLEVPMGIVRDNATHSVFHCSNNTPGSCAIDSEVKTNASSSASFNGASTGQSNFSGSTFTPSRDMVDENGYSKSAAITAWSIPSLASNAANILTLTTTLNPPVSTCITVAGLTVGAAFNSGNSCWIVSASGSTSLSVLVPVLSLPASLPLSQTESGTATVYQPAMQFHWQAGVNCGTNCGWDFNYFNGTGWNPAWSMRQGAVAGSANLAINANTSISGALSTNFPFTSGLLSNLAPNSANFAAGTWALTSMTAVSGQTDQNGGTTATQITVGGTPNGLAIDNYTTTPLTAHTTYNVCAWLRGNAGGENVSLTAGNVLPFNHYILSTSWHYYCGVTTTGTVQLSQIVSVSDNTIADVFFSSGVSVTALGNSSAYLATGATPSPTPTATMALPWLTPGNLCAVTGGIITTSGCSTSPVPLSAQLTTTSATTDNVTITGMTSSGHCSIGAQNASAATNIATSFISAYTTNQITLTHTATASMIYDFVCTAN